MQKRFSDANNDNKHDVSHSCQLLLNAYVTCVSSTHVNVSLAACTNQANQLSNVCGITQLTKIHLSCLKDGGMHSGHGQHR